MNPAQFARCMTALSATVVLASCTSTALRTSTLAQGASLTEMIDTMVLDNLESIREDPHALPWDIKVTQGAVGITDTGSLNASFTWPTIARTIGVTPSRAWSVSWTIVPVIDKKTLNDLRGRYQSEVNDPHFAVWYGIDGSVPADAISTTHGKHRIWVKDSDAFATLVLDVLDKAKVTDGERSFQLPGPQAPPPH